jgi:hypothetical protein
MSPRSGTAQPEEATGPARGLARHAEVTIRWGICKIVSCDGGGGIVPAWPIGTVGGTRTGAGAVDANVLQNNEMRLFQNRAWRHREGIGNRQFNY